MKSIGQSTLKVGKVFGPIFIHGKKIFVLYFARIVYIIYSLKAMEGVLEIQALIRSGGWEIHKCRI